MDLHRASSPTSRTLLFVQRAADLARYKWTFFAVGAALLLLPLVPGLGRSFGGARIWVSIGPINFQPGEFAKIALALFFAGYLAERRELIAAGTWKVGPLHLPEPRHLLPIALAWGFSVVVMVGQKDLGASLLFFTLFVVMLWVATERASVPGASASLLFAGAAYVAWRLFDNVQTRVAIWRNPWPQYEGKGYQIIQAMFALVERRHGRHRARPRQPEQDPRGEERLHLRRDRRGARPVRRRPRCSSRSC